MKTPGAYYDFRKNLWDNRATPTDWADYLPQDPIVQNLYQLYLDTNGEPHQAALEVLKLCILGGLCKIG